MEPFNVPAPVVLAGVGFVVAVVLARWSGARRGRAQADAVYRSARLVSLAGRVVVNAGVLVAVQWAVIELTTDWWWTLAALGVPALFAVYPVTRALLVSTVDLMPSRTRRGGRR